MGLRDGLAMLVLMVGALLDGAAWGAPQALVVEGVRIEAVPDGSGEVLRIADRDRGKVRALVPVRSLDRRQSGRVAQLLALPARRSVLVAFDGLAEWWEVPLAADAPDVYDGWVHDWAMREGIAQRGQFHPKRTPLLAPLPMAQASPDGSWVLGRDAGGTTWVVQLDARTRVMSFAWPGAASWEAARFRLDDGCRGWWLQAPANRSTDAADAVAPRDAATAPAAPQGWCADVGAARLRSVP